LSEEVEVRYQVHVVRDKRCNGHVWSTICSWGITWDDAREKCHRRGTSLARVFSAAEHAALVAEVANAHRFEAEYASRFNLHGVGSQFNQLWLGGYRALTGATVDPLDEWRWDQTFYET
jgi:hypothetical protein